MSELRIKGVAVKFGDLCICLPKPNRHHDCFRYAHDVLGLTPPYNSGAANQGFYLSDGSYLTRQQAWCVAVADKHEMRPSPTDGHVNKSGILFSEDLW